MKTQKEYSDALKAGTKYGNEPHFKEYTRDNFASNGEYKRYVESKKNRGTSKNGRGNNSETSKASNPQT